MSKLYQEKIGKKDSNGHEKIIKTRKKQGTHLMECTSNSQSVGNHNKNSFVIFVINQFLNQIQHMIIQKLIETKSKKNMRSIKLL